MPYKSKKQAAFVHIEAEKGAKWAKKMVKELEGTHIQKPKGKKSAGKPKK